MNRLAVERKIEAIARGTAVPEAERNPATAHLFIVNPLHAAGLQSLFATHPSTEERVRRLEAMAASAGASIDAAGPWGARPRGLA